MHYRKYVVLFLSCQLTQYAKCMENELHKMSLKYILTTDDSTMQRPEKYRKNLHLYNLLETFKSCRNHNSISKTYFAAIYNASPAECRNLHDEENGWTALHYAAFACSIKSCKYLVQIGCDIAKKDKNGLLPYEVTSGRDTRDYLIKEFNKAQRLRH